MNVSSDQVSYDFVAEARSLSEYLSRNQRGISETQSHRGAMDDAVRPHEKAAGHESGGLYRAACECRKFTGKDNGCRRD
jgi:hypothetical protein